MVGVDIIFLNRRANSSSDMFFLVVSSLWCVFSPFLGSDSPTYADSSPFFSRNLLSPATEGGFHDILSAHRNSNRATPNEISAPYEVPQFPIEEIERKLATQRQLSIR